MPADTMIPASHERPAGQPQPVVLVRPCCTGSVIRDPGSRRPGRHRHGDGLAPRAARRRGGHGPGPGTRARAQRGPAVPVPTQCVHAAGKSLAGPGGGPESRRAAAAARVAAAAGGGPASNSESYRPMASSSRHAPRAQRASDSGRPGPPSHSLSLIIKLRVTGESPSRDGSRPPPPAGASDLEKVTVTALSDSETRGRAGHARHRPLMMLARNRAAAAAASSRSGPGLSSSGP